MGSSSDFNQSVSEIINLIPLPSSYIKPLETSTYKIILVVECTTCQKMKNSGNIKIFLLAHHF